MRNVKVGRCLGVGQANFQLGSELRRFRRRGILQWDGISEHIGAVVVCSSGDAIVGRVAALLRGQRHPLVALA